MPWIGSSDFILDEQHVSDDAPSSRGVIYLHNLSEHIYLAGVSNIRTALFRILQGQFPCVLGKQPLRFSYQQTQSVEETIELVLKLTNELRPLCNPERQTD